MIFSNRCTNLEMHAMKIVWWSYNFHALAFHQLGNANWLVENAFIDGDV